MNRFLLALSRIFIISLVTAVVIAAVLVGVGRQLLTQVHEAHPQIESYLSETTGLAIRFDGISGQWHKLTPKLNVNGLALRKDEASDPFLSVDQVSAEINLGNSFLYLRPIIKLWVNGLNVEVVYTDGEFVVKNAPESQPTDEESDEAPSNLANKIDFFLKQPLLDVSNSNIVIKNFWQHEVLVSDINIGMARLGANKRFWADLVLKSDTDISLNMMGDVNGRFIDPESLNGNLYAKLSAPDLEGWMPIPVKKITSFNVLDAKGEVEIWGKLNAGELERVTSRLQLADVIVEKENSEVHPPKLRDLTGVLKWEGNLNENWVLGFDHLSILSDEFVWAPEHLVIRSDQQDSKSRRYIGRIDNATLGPWVQYYASFLDPESGTCTTLQTVQPDAQLENILFAVQVDDSRVVDFNIMANATQLTTKPLRWIPGVNNVSAKILLGMSESIIELQGKAVDLDYPDLFRENLLVDEVKGALLFVNNDAEFRIESGLLEVNDAQLKGATQLAVIVDKKSDKSPYLRLQATIRDIDVADNLYAHLPVGVIPAGVNNWIDGAAKKGHLLRGDLLFHGPVDLTEFEPFQYILGFTIDQAELEFLEGWKPVTGVTTDVRVYNGVVDAWATEAQYYGGELDSAWVGTRILENRDVELFVDADIGGKVENLISILSDSPIQDITAPIMETIGVQGDGRVALDIVVPFKETPEGELPLSLAVGVDLANGQFEVKGNDLIIQNLAGRVDFDLSKGLSSPGLVGELFNTPVKATIATQTKASVTETIVTAKGKANLESIKPWLNLEVLQPLSGNFDYQAKVHIFPDASTTAGQESFVEVKSDLVGVDIPYPMPFSKKANASWPLRFKTTLSDQTRSQQISLNDLFDLKMEFKDSVLQRGAIAFYEQASLPEAQNFTVGGMFETLDLEAWGEALSQFGSKTAEATGDHASPPLLDLLGKSHLFVKQLNVAGQSFANVTANLEVEDEGFRLSVKSPQVAAVMTLPVEYVHKKEYRKINKPVNIQIKELALAFEKKAKTSKKNNKEKPKQQEPTLVSIDPRLLPALDLNIEQLQISGENFGRWQVRAIPKSEGLELKKIYSNFKGVEFNGKGDWVWNSGKPKTQLKGKATAKNVANVLSEWGYAKSITSDQAQASISGGWPGAPFQFDLMQTNADISLVLKDGKFKDVNSGTADKVLGILNFDDWLSRMSLKISELDSDEMPYRVIRGDIKIIDKTLYSNGINVSSAAITMDMKGGLNMEKESIDAQLEVTIPVTRNLVLPAAAVGGLPAAATVYVIEKVLGSQLNKLTTMKYVVKGNVNDPKVTLKESFNIIPKQIQKSIVSNGDKPKGQAAAKDKPTPMSNKTVAPAAPAEQAP